MNDDAGPLASATTRQASSPCLARPGVPGWSGAVPPLAVLALAAVLRVAYLLNRGDLWIDEAISVSLARLGPLDLYHLFSVPPEVKSTVLHPDGPLHSLLLRAWTLLAGRSEVALRSLSLLLGLLAIGLLWQLVAENLDRRTATLSALLMAIAPLQLHYSSEGRCYALFVLLTVGVLRQLLRICREQRGHLLYVVFATLSAFTFYYGFLVLLACNVAFPWHRAWQQRKRLWRWLGSQAAIALLLTPWVPVVLHQYAGRAGLRFGSWGEYGVAVRELAVELTGANLPESLQVMLLALVAVLAIAGAVALRHRPFVLASLLAWVLLPLLLHRWLATLKIVGRAFLFVTPALSVLLAAAAAAALNRPRRAVSAATILLFLALVACNLVGGWSLYRAEATRRTSYPSLSTVENALRDAPADGAVLVLERGKLAPLFEYYLDERIPIVGFSPSEQVPPTREVETAFIEQSIRLMARTWPEQWVCRYRHRPSLIDSLVTRTSARQLQLQDLDLDLVRANALESAAPPGPNEGRPPEANHFLTMGQVPRVETLIALPERSHLRLLVLARYPRARPFFGQAELRLDGRLADSTLVGSDYASVYLLEGEAGPGAVRASVTMGPPP